MCIVYVVSKALFTFCLAGVQLARVLFTFCLVACHLAWALFTVGGGLVYLWLGWLIFG